jgi:hypothetical protein
MFRALITRFVPGSGACEVWILECYEHRAPLALKAENIESNDL